MKLVLIVYTSTTLNVNMRYTYIHDKSSTSFSSLSDNLAYAYILSTPLGKISGQTKEDYTHAVLVCFRSKEDLAKFYENPLYLEVLKEHVVPYCHVCPDM